MGEFDLIAKYFLPLTLGNRAALNLEDDAAIIEFSGKKLVFSMDAMTAGIHFFADDPPGLVARKLLRTNLSDMAAMGAQPMGAFLATAFPQTCPEEYIARFSQGLLEDCQLFNTPILGGDTIATQGPATFALTIIGEAPNPIFRKGAKPGDYIMVSGTLGDAALGLRLCQSQDLGITPEAENFLKERFHLPTPRLELGLEIAPLVSAGMDISDGLIGDLAHICKVSQVGAEIEAEKIPLSPAAKEAIALNPDLFPQIISVGDDYELLFTASRPLNNPNITIIGRIIPDQEIRLLDKYQQNMVLNQSGYRHF